LQAEIYLAPDVSSARFEYAWAAQERSAKWTPHRPLFGRAVQVLNMGNMGHTAAIFPDKYVELLEQMLA
jgi:6-phosphogluconolactonase/glucosamine-6-phosphate isomerase/deaminase